MYRFLSIALLFFVSTNTDAQHVGQQSSYALRNYTAIHGLPQSQVSSIVEDGNGYLWIATWGGGLARFDGQDFKVYMVVAYNWFAFGTSILNPTCLFSVCKRKM